MKNLLLMFAEFWRLITLFFLHFSANTDMPKCINILSMMFFHGCYNNLQWIREMTIFKQCCNSTLRKHVHLMKLYAISKKCLVKKWQMSDQFKTRFQRFPIGGLVIEDRERHRWRTIKTIIVIDSHKTTRELIKGLQVCEKTACNH